jgi:predicted transcriptional regulator
MHLRREHRDREDTEVAVLDALADRHEEGMTVFELRSVVGADIDELETALSGLQSSGLVSVDRDGKRTVFLIEESAIEPETGPDTERGVLEWLSDRFGF